MKNVELTNIIDTVKKSKFCLNSGMPLGYVYGLPALTYKNSKLCLIIPFLKYQVTGEVDKTLVYPIKYLVTISLPQGKIIGFENLEYEDKFSKMDFSKPVGFFRHEAVKQYTKAEYIQKKEELFTLYDKVIASMLKGNDSCECEKDFKELLNIILEPSLKPMYKAFDEEFYNKYLA